jgi:hypothetical protein
MKTLRQIFSATFWFVVLTSLTGCVAYTKLNYWEPRGPGKVMKSQEGARQILLLNLATNAQLTVRVSEKPERLIAGAERISKTNLCLVLRLRLGTNAVARFAKPSVRFHSTSDPALEIDVPNWSEWRITEKGRGYFVERGLSESLGGKTAVVTILHGVKEGSIGEYMCNVPLPKPDTKEFSIELPKVTVNGADHSLGIIEFTNKIEGFWYFVNLQ